MAWPRPDQQAAKEERCEGEDTDGIRQAVRSPQPADGAYSDPRGAEDEGSEGARAGYFANHSCLYAWNCVWGRAQDYRLLTQRIPMEYKDILDDLILVP